MKPDDYYSATNAKYLGTDGAATNDMRLIEDEEFERIQGNTCDGNIKTDEATAELQANSQVITVEEEKIQEDVQSVRDNSASSGNENQVYVVLDRKEAVVTTTPGPTGDNKNSTISYYPAPTTGVNFETPGGRIIIGQIHGHPKTNDPNMSNVSSVSKDNDVPTAKDMKMSIYAVDAYTGGQCKSSSVHRVSSNGTITNNIGKTNGRTTKSIINFGRDALETWGGR